jgi:RES domain-containing protein
MKAYRLCGRSRDPKDASGAFHRGGRWNSPGIRVLYCASSLSLACLEQLVHVRSPDNLPLLHYAEVSIPVRFVRPWRSHLSGWGEFEQLRSSAILESLVLSREVGDNWVHEKPGPLARERKIKGVLQVPSAVIPQEWNYIINPASPDFQQAVWAEPRPFDIDPRLLWPDLR